MAAGTLDHLIGGTETETAPFANGRIRAVLPGSEVTGASWMTIAANSETSGRRPVRIITEPPPSIES